MIFGAYREVIGPGVGGRRLGHRPAGEHPVVLQPHVVVQPTGMVLLNDESKAVGLLIGRPGRYGLRRLGRVPHASIGGKAIPETGCQWCERITKLSNSREHLLILELPQLRILQLLPGSRRSNPRPLAATQ